MTPSEISLRDYMERLFTEHAKEHEFLRREQVLIQTALNKAEQSMNERLAGMNEFRAALNDQKNSFATKDMIAPLQKFQDKLLGVAVGLTILNGIVTYLIVRLLSQ